MSRGIERVRVEGAVVVHKTGKRGSKLCIETPNRRDAWLETHDSGTYTLELRPQSARRVKNVITGGVFNGPVSMSGSSSQEPIEITITTPPGVKVTYTS